MKFVKSLFFFIIVINLNNCSSLGEAGKVLRNEKNTSTDEFLIEKKGPLTQPPDFKTIPRPGVSDNKGKREDSIKKILKSSKTDSIKAQTKASTTEESILNKIKK